MVGCLTSVHAIAILVSPAKVHNITLITYPTSHAHRQYGHTIIKRSICSRLVNDEAPGDLCIVRIGYVDYEFDTSGFLVK